MLISARRDRPPRPCRRRPSRACRTAPRRDASRAPAASTSRRGGRRMRHRRPLQRRAFDRHEARAEAVHARVVLVARRLVDAALAAERCFERLDRQAVRLHAAIAAAFAHGVVDEQALVRVGEFALLAAAALLGRAGLVVDQHGDASRAARAAPCRVRCGDGTSCPSGTGRDDRRTSAARRTTTTKRRLPPRPAARSAAPRSAVDRLAARHRDRVVVRILYA